MSATRITGRAPGHLWLLAALYFLGLDGLAHYALALCSDHTLVTNLTIWFEVLTGLALAGASFWHLGTNGLIGGRADA